jgi:hydrogenase expression/formation protein HypC
MCLAVPMRIAEVRPDGTGVAELDGSRHDVNLSLVPGSGVGTYVIVHAGFAIEKMNEREANTILALFDELAAMQEGSPPREVH